MLLYIWFSTSWVRSFKFFLCVLTLFNFCKINVKRFVYPHLSKHKYVYLWPVFQSPLLSLLILKIFSYRFLIFHCFNLWNMYILIVLIKIISNLTQFFFSCNEYVNIKKGEYRFFTFLFSLRTTVSHSNLSHLRFDQNGLRLCERPFILLVIKNLGFVSFTVFWTRILEEVHTKSRWTLTRDLLRSGPSFVSLSRPPCLPETSWDVQVNLPLWFYLVYSE